MASGGFHMDVVVDTHSGSLATLNLNTQATLRVGTAEYRPAQRVVLSGHHGQVTLVFNVPQAPATFELVITDVPGAGEVRFAWP